LTLQYFSSNNELNKILQEFKNWGACILEDSILFI
jgi:hypothetical protein